MASAGQVCVIGAQGALGRAACEQFRSAGWTVCPAGRRDDRRQGFRKIDLDRPATIGPALQEVDLIISTVADPGFAAERWVLEHGGLLVNCSHAAGGTAAALNAVSSQPKGTVLLNAGLVPGVANLLAAELLQQHPEADCLEIAFTVLKAGTAGKGGGEFAHHGLTSRSRHRVVKLPMGAFFGELACIEVAEGEDGGFGGVAGPRQVRTYLGFGDRLPSVTLRMINALHLIRMLPRAAFSVNGGEREMASTEPTSVWVGARRGGDRVGAALIECEGDYRTTAASARVFAEMLMGSSRPGCFNPEDLFNLNELFAPLEEIGLRVGGPTS